MEGAVKAPGIPASFEPVDWNPKGLPNGSNDAGHLGRLPHQRTAERLRPRSGPAARPGPTHNYDGAAHARDMQLDGADVSIVYPAHAIFVYLEPDRELGLACLRSYNDWLLEDFQGADPARIVGWPTRSCSSSELGPGSGGA